MNSAGTRFVYVFGTTGELIKIFPMVKAMEELGTPIELWSTSQQIEELPHAIEALGITTKVEWLTKGRRGSSLRSKSDVVAWLVKVSTALVMRARRMRSIRKKGGVVVHGDTMTTAIGAFFARIAGSRVIHVEAGMRSGDIRNPFPEELSRRFVAKVADINYAPGDVPVRNLIGARGDVVDTRLNTIVDALLLAQANRTRDETERFGLVSIHRSELYENEEAFRGILGVLGRHAVAHPLIFIDHPVTAQRMAELGLDSLVDSPNFRRVPKLDYFGFIDLLGKADYVVTDSGGLQQECEITGQPCLVHRAVTESTWKLDKNIVLSRLDNAVLEEFLVDPAKYRHEVAGDLVSPTSIIINDLRTRKLID